MAAASPFLRVLMALHAAASLLRTVIWVAFSLPDSALALIGIRPKKMMRAVVVVQRDEAGVPVASAEAVQVQIQWAIQALRRGANVQLVAAVAEEDGASTSVTLDVRGAHDGAVIDNLGAPGAAFRAKTRRLGRTGAPLRRLTGYGAPILLFAVRAFHGDRMAGVSFGAFADHALVLFGNNPATLAHECGHSCMLLHRSDPGNLMHPRWPRGSRLTRWQAAVLRASPHITYF